MIVRARRPERVRAPASSDGRQVRQGAPDLAPGWPGEAGVSGAGGSCGASASACAGSVVGHSIRAVSEEIRQIEPEDEEIQEEWIREAGPGRTVSASRVEEIGGWQVAIWAMEYVRSDPLETELRREIVRALQAVKGVSTAEEQDREQWFVAGAPAGRDLVAAAARVVDELADQIRPHAEGELG